MKRPLRILALPARRNRRRNPYNAILSDQLERLGCVVAEAAVAPALWRAADIVHVHWPQAPAGEAWHLAIRRTLGLLTILILQKMKGARLVWTVHNVRSHEERRPRFERLLMNMVVRMLDGVLVLNRHTRDEAIARYPRLRNLPWALVPHFIYASAYPPAPGRAEAREKLGLDGDLPVVGFVGELKGYKGLGRAISAILSTPPGSLRALIAGSFKDQGEAARFGQSIDRARGDGHEIDYRKGYLDEQGLVTAMVACDLLLLPYASASNSGFAILAAELGVPMLLADTPVFRDLAEELGRPHRVASENFSGEDVLGAALAAKAHGHARPSQAFFEYRSQARAAEATEAFFRSLVKAAS